METLSMIANIASIILAIVSIGLSLYFFGVSYKANKETTQISGEIKNSTTKLEALFDRLYTDTFNMLKKQNDAMQRHIFKNLGDEDESTINNSDIELTVISIIVRNRKITFDTLCNQIKNTSKEKIEEIVIQQQNKGSIDYDGDLITFKNQSTSSSQS